jgi:hypothetical protein
MNNHPEYCDRIDTRAFYRQKQREKMIGYLTVLFTMAFVAVLIWGIWATKHISDY